MSDVVRRAFLLKMRPSQEQAKILEQVFGDWGSAITYTIRYINRIHQSYEKISNPPMAKCNECTEEKNLLYLHKKTKTKICGKCFSFKWSMQTLTKADGFQKDLIENFSELAKAHKGYYAGVIKFGVPAFKSWLAKKREREWEIQQLETELNSIADLAKQIKLRRKLRKKMQGIKELKFNNRMIYFGNGGMFEFRPTTEYGREIMYEVGITHPHLRRTKIWMPIRIGKEESYKTQHDKHELIKNCIETKQNKELFGKIIRSPNDDGEWDYEFMYPAKDLSDSISTKEGVMKYYQENLNTPLILISYGVKKPIQMVVMQKNKIVEIKSFGDGSFWHKICQNNLRRRKVMRKMAKKYKSLWERNKHKKKFWKKQGEREQNYINYYTHKLTTQVIWHVSKKYPNSIIIMRDTKKLKRISYPQQYRTVLHRWNMAIQQFMLDYKAKLENCHLFIIPYNQSNNLTCGKCSNLFQDNKKSVKTLTIKIKHGMNAESYLKQKIKTLTNKIFKIQKLKDKEKIKWLQETSQKLTEAKNLLNKKSEENSWKTISCASCGHSQNFDVNDCLSLHSSFTKMTETAKTQAV